MGMRTKEICALANVRFGPGYFRSKHRPCCLKDRETSIREFSFTPSESRQQFEATGKEFAVHSLQQEQELYERLPRFSPTVWRRRWQGDSHQPGSSIVLPFPFWKGVCHVERIQQADWACWWCLRELSNNCGTRTSSHGRSLAFDRRPLAMPDSGWYLVAQEDRFSWWLPLSFDSSSSDGYRNSTG